MRWGYPTPPSAASRSRCAVPVAAGGPCKDWPSSPWCTPTCLPPPSGASTAWTRCGGCLPAARGCRLPWPHPGEHRPVHRNRLGEFRGRRSRARTRGRVEPPRPLLRGCHPRAARAVCYPSASIASATSPAAASGIALAASSRTSSRAPGISRAIASPLPTGKNGSRRPWTTSVGTSISGRRLRQRGLQSSLANTMLSWLAIWTGGAVPGVRSQMRAAIARAATGSSPRISAPAAANSATASRSVQSGIGRVNRRFIVALSWSGRSASGFPGATARVPARVSAENAPGWSSAATWATIPPTPIPARCAGPPQSAAARAAASAARRSQSASGQDSIVVAPASRTSGASWSPKDSMPRATPLALTVVIGSSPSAPIRESLALDEHVVDRDAALVVQGEHVQPDGGHLAGRPGDQLPVELHEVAQAGRVAAQFEPWRGEPERAGALAKLLGRVQDVLSGGCPQLADDRTASIGVRLVPQRHVAFDERLGVDHRHLRSVGGVGAAAGGIAVVVHAGMLGRGGHSSNTVEGID